MVKAVANIVKMTGWSYKTIVQETPFKPMMLIAAFMQDEPPDTMSYDRDEFWATAHETDVSAKDAMANVAKKFNLKVVTEDASKT